MIPCKGHSESVLKYGLFSNEELATSGEMASRCVLALKEPPDGSRKTNPSERAQPRRFLHAIEEGLQA